MGATTVEQVRPAGGPPRRRGPTRTLAWLLAVVVVLLVGSGFTAMPAGDLVEVLDSLAALVAGLTLAITGAVLISRLPSHRIGWLLLIGGLLFTYANTGAVLATALQTRGFAFASWVFWLAGLCWVPAIVCVAVLIPLLFPTGNLPSRRWRLVVVVALVSIALSTINSAITVYGPGGAPAGISNPVGVTGSLADAIGLVSGLSNLAGVVVLPLVAASLVVRYRRAAGIERAQLRWFAGVVAIIGPAFALGIALGQPTTEPAITIGGLAFLGVFVGFALLPVAIGIAVLRYHLYDIDVIVRRTAVYVPLTAILAGLYAASIALLQRLFVAATGGPSDGAVILSTLILASTFTPIRSWLQGIVDRRFGAAGDAQHLLEKFVSDIATAPWAFDPARTMRAFLAICVGAVGAAGGVAYVGAGEGERGAGRIGAFDVGLLTIPIEAAGRRVGRLELAGRPDRRPYTDRDVALLHRTAAELAASVEPASSA